MTDVLTLANVDRIIRTKYDVPDDAMLGWHFIPGDKHLGIDEFGNYDGREVKVGETLSAIVKPLFGAYALCASQSISLAMTDSGSSRYQLCLVWVRGLIHTGRVKHRNDEETVQFWGSQRHCLAILDYDIFWSAWDDYKVTLNKHLLEDRYETADGQTDTKRYLEMMEIVRQQFELDVLKLMDVLED